MPFTFITLSRHDGQVTRFFQRSFFFQTPTLFLSCVSGGDDDGFGIVIPKGSGHNRQLLRDGVK